MDDKMREPILAKAKKKDISRTQFIKGDAKEDVTNDEWVRMTLRMPRDYKEALRKATEDRPGVSNNLLILEAIKDKYMTS